MIATNTNVEWFREEARRAIPRALFDFIDGGAEDEWTLNANRRAYQGVTFQPRAAVRNDRRDLSCEVLGTKLSMPLILAPAGPASFVHPDGDVGVARAATNAGTVWAVPMGATSTLEHLAQSVRTPLWMQLYGYGGRTVMEGTLARAQAAGYAAVVLTIDTPVSGLRERDVRNQVFGLMKAEPAALLKHGPGMLMRPRWLRHLMRKGGTLTHPNAVVDGKPLSVLQMPEALQRHAWTWDDVRWVRELWSGPLLVKGVLTVADAQRARDLGVNGVVVSNHGGRQLEGAPPTLAALGPIVDAVGNDLAVLMDGGVRRGTDIVKAVAMGAKAVLIGRPWLYGLAAGGERGVSQVLELFRRDLDRTLTLLGCASIADLDRSLVSLLGIPSGP